MAEEYKEMFKKIQFEVNHRYDTIKITSISEWDSNNIAYFCRYLISLGVKELSDD